MISSAAKTHNLTDRNLLVTDYRIVIGGFFTDNELDIFSRLINNRRDLPVYHGYFWRCGVCSFESCDFATVAAHIMDSHKPTPFNEEDMTEQ